MFKKVKYLCCMLIIFGIFSQAASAVIISMTPSSQSLDLGDTAFVDVSISDFDVSESLGDFQFTILFNEAVVSLTDVVYGTELGFDDPFDALFGPGEYDITNASLEFDPAFFDAQSDNFVLFSMEFTAIGFGSSIIDASNVFLGDELGLDLLFNPIESVSIDVPDPNAVSEPSHLAILLIGLGVFAWRKHA